MKIFKIFLLILFFTLFTSNSYSKENDKNLRVNFSNFVSIGYNTIDISKFDKTLIKNNYLPFSNNFISIGTGNRGLSGNLILGGEGSFSLEKKNINSNNNYLNYVSSSINIIGNIGYIIYEKNNIIVYPLIGLGLSKISFDFVKNEKPSNINDILRIPNRSTRLENIGITGDIGLEAGYLIGVGKSDNKKGGIAFGLRLGYIFTVYQTDLKFKEFNINEVPDINFNGVYIKFLAGFTGSIIPTLFDLF